MDSIYPGNYFHLEKLSSDELRLGLRLSEEISSADEWILDAYRALTPVPAS